MPALGIEGIVIGTVVARAAGGLLMLFVLGKGVSGLKLKRRELRLRGETVRRILRIGGPAALDGAVMWGGHLAFLAVISHLATGPLQTATLAAHMVGVRVEAINYLPAFAWGSAAATMVGQALGAGDKRRALLVGHEATFQCALLSAVLTVVFFTQADAIYAQMHSDPTVRAVGAPAFRLLAFFLIPSVMSTIYLLSLRGAGDTRFPLYVSLAGTLLVRLPLAYTFGIILQGGLVGAWIGMVSDMAFRALAIVTRYMRGRWLDTAI